MRMKTVGGYKWMRELFNGTNVEPDLFGRTPQELSEFGKYLIEKGLKNIVPYNGSKPN